MRKISPPTGIRSPEHAARSESLYQLSYPGPYLGFWFHYNLYKPSSYIALSTENGDAVINRLICSLESTGSFPLAVIQESATPSFVWRFHNPDIVIAFPFLERLFSLHVCVCVFFPRLRPGDDMNSPAPLPAVILLASCAADVFRFTRGFSLPPFSCS